MAQRRMFSKVITSSARFLKMPQEAQNLYFHLCMNADDDGIVEAFTIMQMLGSSEDNIRILSAKGLVQALNEDMVTYITDWSEHNLIRADRKVNSIYKDLLVKILPEVRVKDPKPRADTGVIPRQLGTGQQLDVQWTAQDRIGKERLGKEKNTSLVLLAKIDFPVFWELYPNKTNKKKSELKWNKLDLKTQQFIIADLKKRKLGEKWMKDKGKYIEMPLTYLNGERWNDEIIEVKVEEVKKTHRI